MLLSVLKKEKEHIEGEKRLLKYIHLYHSECTQEKIIGKPEEEILHTAQMTENPLVVMGAFGRSAFLRFFKSSIGKKVIESQSVPVFVAHE